MVLRHHHYEQAFEHYLQANTISYLAVDEARRPPLDLGKEGLAGATDSAIKLKNFDFVINSPLGGASLLVDVKGRRLSPKRAGAFQNWVTADDIDHFGHWERLFGQKFTAVFAFLFWCDAAPPDALFQEVFEYGKRWYVMLAIRLEDYRKWMRPRSVKWETVSLPTGAFRDLSQPLGHWLGHS